MHHTLRAVAVAAALALSLATVAGCGDDEKTPAEARRERVESRLRDSFSAAQAGCILERVDEPVLEALDGTTDLRAGTTEMFVYSTAVAICVTDPDAPIEAPTSSTSTTEPGSSSTTSTAADGTSGTGSGDSKGSKTEPADTSNAEPDGGTGAPGNGQGNGQGDGQGDGQGNGQGDGRGDTGNGQGDEGGG